MKQLIQNLRRGDTLLEDVPVPIVGRGFVLIRTSRSLVSLGTERSLVEFGKAGLIAKARQQPDKVKKVLDKFKTEGLLPTLDAVFKKLNQPLPLGYCNVGEVVEVGGGVRDLKVGDRVASNGQHAEYVLVPENLVVKIPDVVTDEEATFAVIGAIGLQGIRLCKPTLGENIVVVGLGLIGLLTVQLLKANGCRVIGIEPDAAKRKMASNWGISAFSPDEGNVVERVMTATGDIGADGVIITASAKTNAIISQAAQMSRKRGRIILVGVIGLELNRAEFYQKELTFQVSCSYGPGRYDEDYEQRGLDYPLPFVRWTEKRNFEAVLQAIATGQLKVTPLITEQVPLEEFQQIYGDMRKGGSIASILVYRQNGPITEKDRILPVVKVQWAASRGSMAIVGAGNFTTMTMLPALKKAKANIKYIVSQGGLSSKSLAKKYDIPYSATDLEGVLRDDEVSMVLIATRHNLHAPMVVQALEQGKHVFVEKPLALHQDELDRIIKVYYSSESQTANQVSLSVGFNRRFSPHIQAIQKVIGLDPGPMNITATINAGYISPEFWVHDLDVGGGRILGEACHFIDLMVALTGSLVSHVCINALGPNPSQNTDNASILLRFANGSHGVVNYFANGSKAYSKERLELYYQSQTLVVDNFRKTKGFGTKGFKNLNTKLDKGHVNQFIKLQKFVSEGGPPLIPFEEIINVSRVSLAALESFRNGSWVAI